MICHPRPIQLASILPPPSGHRKCYMQFTVTMPGAEAHIVVQRQNEILVMIDYFTDVNLTNSDDGLYLESTLRNQSQTESRVEAPMNPNSNSITIPNHEYTATEPRWQSTINTMEKSSTEQRIFKRGRYLCLYNKVLQKS